MAKGGGSMILGNLLPLIDKEQWVSLELTYRDDENTLTREHAWRQVKDIEEFFKYIDLRIYEFDVMKIIPIYEMNPLISLEPKVYLRIIVRRYY